jgi:hypothetical protein
MAEAATHILLFEGDAGARRRPLVEIARSVARHIPLLLVIGLVVGIHVPTMHYYFFGDDFLVLGDIQSRSFTTYMRDVVALRDLTPNWRPLTMLVYWAEFKVFGFDALPWRIVNLSLHVGTVVILYALVLSLTKRLFVALAAALIFGVSASAVHTVTYITAFPHVFSQFLLMCSLGSLHLYVQSAEKRWWWYWASLLLFIAGFLANEGGVVMGAVLLVYFAIYSLAKKRDVLDFVLKMTPFGIAAAVLVSGLSGCGCQGVEEGFYGVGWHIPRETWVYMSRLAYPVGAIPLEPSAMEWIWGSIVIGFAIFFFIRGPNIARVAAVGMVIAVMPYTPGKIWTATRYSYMATPFFAILVAVAAGLIHHYATRVYKPAAHVLAAAALVAVGGLYAWQTHIQTEPFLEESDRWELLATEMRSTYDTVPPGTTVYIIDDDDMWSNGFWQPTWMTSIGRALYGRDVKLRALTSADAERIKRNVDPDRALFVRLVRGRLVKVSSPVVVGGG